MKKLLTLFAILIIVLSSNSLNAQTYVSGLISSNTNWTIGSNPYIVTGNVLLVSGFTLTIEPGVMVKFNSGLSIQIDGTLLAQGTNDNKITFTSNTADTAGAWGYIYFSDASVDAVFENNIYGNYISGSILEYCVIEYAGGTSVSDNGALRLDNAHPFVNHCTISDNSETGIRAYNLTGSLKISNCNISNNSSSNQGGGIFVSSNNTLQIVIADNNVSYNTAAVSGGGIVAYGSIAVINNLISNNISNSDGGGIAASHSTTISGNIIINNTALTGGGVFDGGSATITNNAILNNTSTSGIALGWGGGGIGNYNSAVISNNVISDNHSNSTGGGIWGINGSAILNNHIIRNTAINDAGINLQYYNCNFNTIVYNKNTDYNNTFNRGIYINGNPVLNNNNIFNNSAFYELYNGNAQGSANVNGTNNWWGTANDAEIQAKIYDWFDDNSLGIVNYSPYVTAPDTAAPVSPPANVIKTNLGGGQVQITWVSNPESDVAGYHVYYGGFNGYSFTNVVTVGNITSYILSGVSFTDTIGLTAYDHTYSPANEYDSTIVNDNMTNGNESWFTFAVDTSTTDVTQNDSEIPKAFALHQNYPNPFNPSTVISYNLPVISQVSLKVYDVLGREAAILFNEIKSAGTHKLTFDGSGLASGIYYYQLSAGSFSESKKMILLK